MYWSGLFSKKISIVALQPGFPKHQGLCNLSSVHLSNKTKASPRCFPVCCSTLPGQKRELELNKLGGGIKRNPAIARRGEAALVLLPTGQDAPSLHQDAQHTSQQHPHRPSHPSAERWHFVDAFYPKKGAKTPELRANMLQEPPTRVCKCTGLLP